MKRQKRWMKSVIETSNTDLPTLPWARRKVVTTPRTLKVA